MRENLDSKESQSTKPLRRSNKGGDWRKLRDSLGKEKKGEFDSGEPELKPHMLCNGQKMDTMEQPETFMGRLGRSAVQPTSSVPQGACEEES